MDQREAYKMQPNLPRKKRRAADDVKEDQRSKSKVPEATMKEHTLATPAARSDRAMRLITAKCRISKPRTLVDLSQRFGKSRNHC